MSATKYPFQMVGGVPVVTAPPEIDATTVGELRAILLEWHSRGHTTVVVDMTGTLFCDSAGLRELVWAHKREVAESGGLRLGMPPGGAGLRVLAVTGLGHLPPRFAVVDRALARAPAASRPLRPGPDPEPAAAPAGPQAQDGERGATVDSRSCEQCGAAFVPQREHARFCSADCRAAWNRAHMG